MKEYNKHIDYIDNNWDFCFEYLTRETIIDIICRYANEEPVMLASMIKAFKYSNSRTASEYTGLAIYLAYKFEWRIFNTKLTDMSKICLDDYDYRHSKVVHSNKSGKIMIA